jgi:2'-5' RNA ligase
VRLFVAVDLPGASRDRIESLIADLRREVPDVRWARIEGVHLTLKFLGEVEEGRLPALASILDRRAAAAGGFTVRLQGVGTFGDRSRPRVVWCGVTDPGGGLARLAASIDEGCAETGVAKEARPFHPHLTLARLKSPSRGLAAALEARADLDLGGFAVTSFHLFQSLLRPQGAAYLRLAEHRLGGAAAPS